MSEPSRWKIFGVVSFYMGAALVMVFVNKAVLKAAPDLAFTFLLSQTVIANLLLQIAALITPRIALPKLDWDIAKKLIPLITVGLTGLAFNTLCLRAIDASFYQIARGLSLPITIVCSSLATRERPTAQVLLAAGIVTAGFFFGVVPVSLYASRDAALPTASKFIGVVYGVFSSFLLAVHAVLTKPAHAYVDNSSIKLAYYVYIGDLVLLLPFTVLNGEVSRWMEPQDWRVFVLGSAVTGVFGFFLCIAGLLSIKVTSPVTHMFSSAARSVLQTILGAVIFGDIITANRGVSITVITAGTLYYTWHKSSAPKQATPNQPQTHDIEKRPLTSDTTKA